MLFKYCIDTFLIFCYSSDEPKRKKRKDVGTGYHYTSRQIPTFKLSLQRWNTSKLTPWPISKQSALAAASAKQ